ncbi:MOSC N-terminal beta barrel domain-containing protein [Candidatus Saccharibacteria bacterium]|nr:MOSC N-terminal beta barrel domain-containing protein [Candidatus Saccharibacteria bacterium]
MNNIVVSELNIYPVKSCQGISVPSAEVVETGFAYDREYMVVKPDGSFMSQRTMALLGTVQTEIIGNALRLSADKHGEVMIPLSYDQDEKRPIATTVHDYDALGLRQSQDADEFFCDLINKTAWLVRASRREPRYVKPAYQRSGAVNQVAFGDSFPFLLTSEPTLRDLRERQGISEDLVPMNRFRPNIVIDGDIEPGQEDYIDSIRIGDFKGFAVQACKRCVMTGIRQTGEFAGTRGDISVLHHFLAPRQGRDMTKLDSKGGRYFGQSLVHTYGSVAGRVSVGDLVSVELNNSPNVVLVRE